jgi:pimeloyl-ACP methyl ester carboxylesterase
MVSSKSGGAEYDLAPFRIDIPQSDIDDLRTRLRLTRFSDDYDNEDWSYGTNGAFLRKLVAYWLDDYDWRAVEARINRYEHFKVTIEDRPVHFMRIPGRGPSPKPVLLVHGSPWTFWDFARVIEPLTDPASIGGDPADSLELIIPSLPGFAFSTPTRASIGAHDDARILDILMREVLGFDRYGVAGGDWGSSISAHLSHRGRDHVLGAHLLEPDLLKISFEDLTPADYAADEAGWHEASVERMYRAETHVMAGIREPQTVGQALDDSPAGLAAMIVDRRYHWGDVRAGFENVFALEDLVTAVSIYWFTKSMASSLRIYPDTVRAMLAAAAAEEGKEASGSVFQHVTVHDRMPVLEAPTGVGVFAMELAKVPRRIAEEYANLVRWTVFDQGGHFAPYEQAETYSRELLAFFHDLT